MRFQGRSMQDDNLKRRRCLKQITTQQNMTNKQRQQKAALYLNYANNLCAQFIGVATWCIFRGLLTTWKRANMAGISRCCWRCLDPKDFPWKNDSLESGCSSSRLFIKPPNIFCRNLDKQAIDSFKSTVDPSLYTLYALSDNDWKFNVWQNSTNLLIISDKSSVENQRDEIAKTGNYLVEHRGRVLLILSDDCDHSPGAHSISSALKTPDFSTQTNGWIWRVVDGCLCLLNEQEAPVMVVTKSDCRDIKPVLVLLGISCAQQTERSSSASATTLYTCKPPDSADAELSGFEMRLIHIK
ncbi:hypothetical protein TSMEX_008823 [Taenia solium]|eukprot:TsM_000451600 transcript=TsM_000451600 gene=TsM_000451600